MPSTEAVQECCISQEVRVKLVFQPCLQLRECADISVIAADVQVHVLTGLLFGYAQISYPFFWMGTLLTSRRFAPPAQALDLPCVM